jgi:diguanylate cyclase (GGDEF)-like protein
MSGNYLLSLGVPLVSICLAATFYLLWRQQPHRAHLKDWALVYALGVVGFTIELMRVYGFGDFVSLLSNMFHGLGVVFTARGVFTRYGNRRHERTLWVLYGAGIVGVVLFSYALPNVIARSASMSIAISLMLALAAWCIFATQGKDLVDRLLVWLMATIAVVVLLRPAVAFVVDMPAQIGAVDPDSLFVVALKLQSLVGWIGFAILFLMRTASDVTIELKDQARRDPMTGILNRRGFFEQAALDLAQRDSAVTCSVVIVDIDHFKSINDRFGHAVGDDVICGVANIMASLPFQPIIGRIGGEEFVILLPTTPLKAATLFAEGIRIGIANHHHESLPAGANVTASFGIAEFKASGDLSEAMRKADIALYVAKRGGRNRVASTDPIPHESASLLCIA